jgi:hypothetical protein
VKLKVGDSHLAGEHEGDRTSEESDDDEKAANELEQSSDAHLRHQGEVRHDRRRRRVVENLHRSGREKNQAGDDAKDAQQPSGPGGRCGLEDRHRCSPPVVHCV